MIKLILAFALVGCAGTKRSPDTYRIDTQRAVEARMGQIERCYAEALTQDATAGGLVAVKFTVEKKTGKVSQVTLEPGTSTAPEPVSNCVLSGLTGLTLAPPDRNDGDATFVFELRPRPAA
jgi:hypothetical protein